MQFHRTKNTLSTSSWCDVSVGNSHCVTYTDQKIVTWNIGITSNLTLLRNTPLVNHAAVLFFRNYSKQQIYFIRSIQQLDSPVFKVDHQSFDSTIQNNNLQLNNYLQECHRSLITYVFLTCYALILWVAVKRNCSVVNGSTSSSAEDKYMIIVFFVGLHITNSSNSPYRPT